MKIALLFSGEPRTYKQCIDSQKEFLLEPYNPDVYLVSPTFEGGESVWWMGGNSTPAQPVDIQDLVDCYNPVKIEVHNRDKDPVYPKFKEWDLNQEPYSLYYMSWKQYYRMWRSIDIIENPEQYDIIIRTRFDLQIDTPIDVMSALKYDGVMVSSIGFFDLEAEEFDCDAVRQQGIRSYRKRWFPGGERLIWGRTDIMKKFLSVYKDLDNIWSDKTWKEYGITEDYHREACSEHLMWHFANKHNIKYFATSLSPVNVKLLRHDGRYIV